MKTIRMSKEDLKEFKSIVKYVGFIKETKDYIKYHYIDMLDNEGYIEVARA